MSSSTYRPRAITCLGLGLVGGLMVGQQLVGQAPIPLPPPGGIGNVPVLPRVWNSYAPVVKRVLPAVVCIEGKSKSTRPKLDDIDPGFGSGVLIDPLGIVLTNNHLVADINSVDVTLQDGRKFTSKEIRRDPKTDLAVIRLEGKEPFPFLEFGDSNAMEIGDHVLACGAPFGLTGSVSHGIISAKNRQNLHLNVFEDFLQVDAAVNPGSSGGPLVNMEGRLIGLTSAIKTRSGGFQGVGLVVSSNLARDIAAQLIKNGAVRRASLGIAVRDLDDTTATKQKLKLNGGVIVSEVTAKSPGEKANIGVGDVITTVNGQAITTTRELLRAVAALPAGQQVEVVVVRNGQAFATRAAAEVQDETAGPMPGPPLQPAMDFDAVGMTVTELTPDGAAKLAVPKNVKGVVVATVVQNGLAGQSGVGRGMVILQVDKAPVATPEEFRAAVERASREKGAVLHVLRPNGEVDFLVLKGQ
ncbi:MAG: trypsin-like peptidase domain-containing protein [Planctomycetes bacterium]|nr:trypsin-like peptidase domain-containing protein [Planctomycetota bacterium]